MLIFLPDENWYKVIKRKPRLSKTKSNWARESEIISVRDKLETRIRDNKRLD